VASKAPSRRGLRETRASRWASPRLGGIEPPDTTLPKLGLMLWPDGQVGAAGAAAELNFASMCAGPPPKPAFPQKTEFKEGVGVIMTVLKREGAPQRETVTTLPMPQSRLASRSCYGVCWQGVATSEACRQVANWLHSSVATIRSAKIYVRRASWQHGFEVANSLRSCQLRSSDPALKTGSGTKSTGPAASGASIFPMEPLRTMSRT
jgi:hypothetical protein